MKHLSVSDLLTDAGAENVLDTLSPEELVEELSHQLIALSYEFPSVVLRVTRRNIPRFVSDLRAGQYKRLFELNVQKGADPETLRETLDPNSFELPLRIETYATFYPTVELKLSAQMAELLGKDLARGIALRKDPTDKEEHIC